MSPVPKSKSFVPVKFKLAPIVMGLLADSVLAVPEVLSNVPPLIVIAPEPDNAFALLILSVPEDNVLVPLMLLVPDRI